MRSSHLQWIAVHIVAVCCGLPAAAERLPHNLILFVPDGMRAGMVTPGAAPTMAEVRDRGVNLRNSHSLFPTFTTANGSAMATGHYLGDTGDFSNTIYTGKPVAAQNGSVTPFVENNAVLGELDQLFEGDWLNEETILRAAAKAGYSTAAIGKVGPTLNFDHTSRTGAPTVIVDDQTGTDRGIPFSPELHPLIEAQGLPLVAPSRGENGKAGNAITPGTLVANIEQQAYFVQVATKVVLPLFKERGKPFLLVFWSRDPDAVQHNHGDSLGRLVPGINGPTTLAGIRNADDNLAALRRTLTELGLAGTTNILIAADHGFSTISKESATSPAARIAFPDVPKDHLPPGFVGLDLARALDMSLFDPDAAGALVEPGKRPRLASALLGTDPKNPDVVVAVNGGSDLIYLPKRDAALARRVVHALMAQDYTSGIFVDDALGAIPGTLPLSSIGLQGNARTPTPSIVVNFRSFTTGCSLPETCVAEIADTVLQQGQGMHGSFSRADTHNFMAAIGPDFKAGFSNPAPVSNADIGQTAAALLGLRIEAKGRLLGRVMREAMVGGEIPSHYAGVIHSASGPGGLRTMLRFRQVGDQRYFDAAGFPGRSFGLNESDE
ncbi:nucleotide pyrophosphatase/phosphodiesterase family protein [Paracraurococcus lichenis]|uniref:Alkaline phosphatase family protein n=1 Tax=Paracraurococcus lichenis TaxID=3064888 RepID=A0ABT9E9P3_9PROT|nr:nucleotide pyrophosphatase/phosphodiesterase family protein [Paracraurococcus sp. LOR1-02]MDO9712927.1 alkaline phosphatase family protein [Paracraurococcus sp. LOR1-02]